MMIISIGLTCQRDLSEGLMLEDWGEFNVSKSLSRRF